MNLRMSTVMLAQCVCLYAAAPMAATSTMTIPKTATGTTTLYKTPITSLTTVAAKPEITGYAPTTCINTNTNLTIFGKNFGAKKGVSLGGHGINVDLPVSTWSTTQIVVRIPADPRIQKGEWYYTGVKDPNTGNWLSNIDKNITICAATTTTITPTTTLKLNTTSLPTITTTPTIPGTKPKPTQPTSPTEPTAPTETPSTTRTAPTETGAASDPYESYYNYDDGSSGNWENYGGYGPEPSTSTVLPNSYGSLMDRQLPPPPPNLAMIQKQNAFIKRHTEPDELVVISANMDEAKQLAQQLGGFGLQAKRRKILKNLGMVISAFRVPPGTDMQQLTANVRQSYPSMWVDMNHRYQLMGDNRNTGSAKKIIHWKDAPGCGKGLRIGLIDTGVDKNHPALSKQSIVEYSVLSRGIKVAKPDHGTGVASLLVGNANDPSFAGLLPSARLFSAAVFRQRDDKHTDTTAEWIVSAIDWLLSQKVQAINMSIGGPRNLLVDVAIQRTIQSGVTVIAAAGNNGPDSTPVYPAAQPGVIAVTAVDSNGRLYNRASHGNYIDFSAPGVDIWTATPGKGGKFVSGTSFATPFVTASMVSLAQRQGPKGAYEQLQKTATDLGDPGKDTAYGWGLLQLAGSCQ